MRIAPSGTYGSMSDSDPAATRPKFSRTFDRSSFYGGDARGYTDYPTADAAAVA